MANPCGNEDGTGPRRLRDERRAVLAGSLPGYLPRPGEEVDG
ncbi:hypothetical protein [Amycolatopsis pigmentata]|uniref:Uncharacterized protein n=1 Tax=Amycolatopsis pigmentata TaxID=450801 RepID=A0ABW5FMA3_9PSEU